MKRLYYVEHDGRVRVARRKGAIDLPGESEVGVRYREVARRRLDDVEVVFASAELDEHPLDWPLKDELACDAAASRILRFSISASLFRPVVGVVVRSGEDVLLVMPARGVAEGRWTLPGGFLAAFEQPDEGARREVQEETGVEVEGLRLLGALTYHHAGSPYPILGLGYTARARSRLLAPRKEEIAQAKWVSVAEAARISGGFAAVVFGQLAQEGGR